MKILITNDDGIYSSGLLTLRQELASLGEAIAVAPERARSATGHAITLHKPLRLTVVKLADGGEGYATNGTPADCVALGVSEFVMGRPDLVVSGINLGPNLGQDMTYSGTVAAAMEAAICGIPSFAISLAAYDFSDFTPAASLACYLAEVVLARGLPAGAFLNVNVPPAPISEIAGVAFTSRGTVRYDNRIEQRTDPRGRVYYWLIGERINQQDQPNTDVGAIASGKISITPVLLDQTDYDLLTELQGWNLKWPPK